MFDYTFQVFLELWLQRDKETSTLGSAIRTTLNLHIYDPLNVHNRAESLNEVGDQQWHEIADHVRILESCVVW